MDFRIIAKINFLILLGICCCCQKKTEIDFKRETQAILALDRQDSIYHFSKNAKAFVANFSDDFMSIGKGKIERPSRENSLQRFDAYFKSVRFIRWDNNQSPVVRFSNDASVAYAAFDKWVVIELENEQGEKVQDTATFAWLSVYKKENDRWKLDCIASTNK